MSDPQPQPSVLSDETLTKIEQKLELRSDHMIPRSKLPVITGEEAAALCATVRAAWKERERGALCEECGEWEYNEDGSCRTYIVCGACWNKRTEALVALREQLAETREELRKLKEKWAEA